MAPNADWGTRGVGDTESPPNFGPSKHRAIRLYTEQEGESKEAQNRELEMESFKVL